jgi:hypothetical protein
MKDDITYDELTDDQKKKLGEIALSLGHKIEGVHTDEEIKEFFTKKLKEDDELREKLGKEKKVKS